MSLIINAPMLVNHISSLFFTSMLSHLQSVTSFLSISNMVLFIHLFFFFLMYSVSILRNYLPKQSLISYERNSCARWFNFVFTIPHNKMAKLLKLKKKLISCYCGVLPRTFLQNEGSTSLVVESAAGRQPY